MTRTATLQVETRLGNPMEPICIHVCAEEQIIATVSLQDFDSTCEALHRIRHNRFVKEGAES